MKYEGLRIFEDSSTTQLIFQLDIGPEGFSSQMPTIAISRELIYMASPPISADYIHGELMSLYVQQRLKMKKEKNNESII